MQPELSPRQIAGAANGRLAAGAKSPEGRARSAANASKHGLCSQHSTKPSRKPSLQPNGKAGVILLNESPAAFDQLFHSLSACFQPSDAHEFTLLRRMAESEWLRQRALLMESAAISEAMRLQALPFQENSGADALDPAGQEALRSWHAVSKLSSANPAFPALQRYAAAHARAYARAERELRDYRIAKAESIHPIPEPLAPSGILQPAGESAQRWQPLETVQEEGPAQPEEASQPEEAAQLAESCQPEATLPKTNPFLENPSDETKVTSTPPPNQSITETHAETLLHLPSF